MPDRPHLSPVSPKIFGIDLGTTNSCLAVMEPSGPRVIAVDGEPVVPSVVSLDRQTGRFVVGRRARNRQALDPEWTVRSIKRRMGETAPVRLGDRELLPEAIAAEILRYLKEKGEEALGEPVARAVITVPAYFGDAQRRATIRAGELSGLEVVRLLNEPTAAALVYDRLVARGVEPRAAPEAPPEAGPDLETGSGEGATQRVLVYDLGGGTFDVSVVEIGGGVDEVLASGGDNRLGGDDFDRRLADHLAAALQEKAGRELPRDLFLQARLEARLVDAAERAKIDLSSRPYTRVVEEALLGSVHLDLEVDRPGFEALFEDLLGPTLAEVDRALAVALGAAVQGAILAGEVFDHILVDVAAHSLGIRTLDNPVPGLWGRRGADQFSTILRRNTQVPATRSELYRTVVDGQEQVEIDVYQGESSRCISHRGSREPGPGRAGPAAQGAVLSAGGGGALHLPESPEGGGLRADCRRAKDPGSPTASPARPGSRGAGDRGGARGPPLPRRRRPLPRPPGRARNRAVAGGGRGAAEPGARRLDPPHRAGPGGGARRSGASSPRPSPAGRGEALAQRPRRGRGAAGSARPRGPLERRSQAPLPPSGAAAGRRALPPAGPGRTAPRRAPLHGARRAAPLAQPLRFHRRRPGRPLEPRAVGPRTLGGRGGRGRAAASLLRALRAPHPRAPGRDGRGDRPAPPGRAAARRGAGARRRSVRTLRRGRFLRSHGRGGPGAPGASTRGCRPAPGRHRGGRRRRRAPVSARPPGRARPPRPRDRRALADRPAAPGCSRPRGAGGAGEDRRDPAGAVRGRGLAGGHRAGGAGDGRRVRGGPGRSMPRGPARPGGGSPGDLRGAREAEPLAARPRREARLRRGRAGRRRLARRHRAAARPVPRRLPRLGSPAGRPPGAGEAPERSLVAPRPGTARRPPLPGGDRPARRPHAVLGLPATATAEELTAAYRKLVRRYPPELAPEPFARIHRAYQLATSLERRMEAARQSPRETLDQLFPLPEMTLKPPPPPPPPLAESDLEILLAPWRRAELVRILRQAFAK